MVAQLAQPSETNFGTGIAGREEGPIGIGIATLTSPGGEEVQSLGDVGVGVAPNVPRRLGAGGPGTFGI